MTNDDEGEGGVTIPPKNDDVIYEQPLKSNWRRTVCHDQEGQTKSSEFLISPLSSFSFFISVHSITNITFLAGLSSLSSALVPGFLVVHIPDFALKPLAK